MPHACMRSNSGKTYEGRTLIAFGGGGPVHACRVAEKVGIRRVLVPSGAGVGSAIGFLRAPVGYEVVRSLYQRFSTFDVMAVNTLLADMEAEAIEVVAQGSFGAPLCSTASPTCAMSARATKFLFPCRRARLARKTSQRSAPPMMPNTPASTTGRCPVRTWKS